MEVTVKLATREGAAHISGILAGFILLAKRGELTLRVQDARQGNPLAREALLETEIDGRTVVFDLMDGYFYNDPVRCCWLPLRATRWMPCISGSTACCVCLHWKQNWTP